MSKEKSMPFQKGRSGNPKGRPPKPETEELRKAIKLVEGRKKKKFLIHIVEEAYEDNKLAAAILKKLVPDLKYIENDHKTNESTMALVVQAVQSIKDGKSKRH
jgi:hypothetical protein